MSETQQLAKWACDLEWKDIPPQTRVKAKQCLMEFLSCCLIARQEEPVRLLIDALKQFGAAPQAAVIGNEVKLSAEQAAMVNGAMGHVWEIDDTHRHTMSHPGDSVIPAALAAAEWMGIADGASVLTAIVSGYEVAIRVCDAVSPSHLEKGWHPTGTTNTFGAAAAVGKLFKLSAAEMASAFGLAATQAAGTFCHLPERAMSKDLNPGRAAASGMISALLARQGFTGSPTAIENVKGFVRTHADAFDLSRITRGLGSSLKIDEIGFKPYSSCRHAHAAIEAMLRLRSAHKLTPDRIKSIKASLYPMAARFVDDPNPFGKGFYGPRYSLQFNLAFVLVAGDAGLAKAMFDEKYTQSMMEDPAVRNEMKKVELVVDTDLAREWPNKWPARVSVVLSDGQIQEQLIEYPLGEPEHPIPYSQLVDKFKRAARGYLTEKEADEALTTIQTLEEPGKIGLLMKQVSGEHGGKKS
jgi:2-methylcitrate dehydratase PrpD